MKVNTAHYSDKADKDSFDNLPEDVKAILDLFPDLNLHIGSYFDVTLPYNNTYVFVQSIGQPENRARFISWVRAGMPEGYNEYDNQWKGEE